VKRLNKKILALTAIIVSMIMTAPLANAQPDMAWTVWTDKAEYAPGESGTLYFTYYNGGTTAVTIKKVIIVYTEWRAYRNGQWDGNQTIELNSPTGIAVPGNGVLDNSTKFTVPTDGRAKTTSVDITIQTAEFGNPSYTYHYVTVVQAPKYMDQIVMLFTILVVLVMVCTAIIAATIFLSARRPQVTWRTEEKQ
jgi:hypothetical protein